MGDALTGGQVVARHAFTLVRELMNDVRVLVIGGPRQAGKTTLLRHVHADTGGSILSLDDPATLAVARRDPVGLLDEPSSPVFIDEVQRAGNPLVLTIKKRVDDSPKPGSFVLSGSTRFLTVPTLSESLAGRAVLIDLWPLSMAERAGCAPDFIERALAAPTELRRQPEHRTSRHEYMRLVCAGGFPEVVAMRSARARRLWFNSYLTTITQRDIVEIADVRRTELLPRLVRLMAALTAQEVNPADVARRLGATPELVRTYLSILETTYVVHRIPAWSRNLASKATHRPKYHVVDTGLAASLLGQSAEALAKPTSPAAGALLESFVVNELRKLSAVGDTSVEIGHFRDRNGREVDCVIEAADGRVVGVEVKATSTPDPHDARHLAMLRDRLGDDFVVGIVLHTGEQALPLGERLLALPVSTLWHGHVVPG